MPDTTTFKDLWSNRTSSFIILAVLLLLMLPGCGGNGGENPAVPPIGNDNQIETPGITGAAERGQTMKAIWGMWDVGIAPDGGLDIVPLRGVEYAFNVNIFLQPPSGSLANIDVSIVDWEKLFIAGDVVVDVALSHPFPALTQFTGFDVLGVLIGTGHYHLNSDSAIVYGNPGLNPVLRNADGYTRWMNPLEFTTTGLLGYTEGAMGNKGEWWGTTLNGYKYFCTDLYPTEEITSHFSSAQAIGMRGMFATNSTVTRRYDIHFPMIDGSPDVRFQYAVVASWVEPANIPPQSIPGDFPAEANIQEPFYVQISTEGSSLYWNDMYDNGGNLFLTLEVFDWQGSTNPSGVAGEIGRIILDSPDEFINSGAKMVFTPSDWTELAGTCSNSVRLALDVGPVDLQGPCPFDNDVLITLVTAEHGDYDNGLSSAYPEYATLSGYQRLFIDLGNVCNDPPVVWFTNCPDYTISTANRTFRWEGEDDVTPNDEIQYRYKMDGDAYSAWETDLTQAYYENMTEETHTIIVQAMDLDGQISEAACTFTIDLPPEPQPPSVDFINCTAYVRTSTYTWNLDLSDDNTSLSFLKVRYNLNSGGWIPMPDGTTSIQLNGLTSGGPNSLIVEVEDLDGMIDQALCEFDVNFEPSVTIDNCPGTDLNVNTYTFNWTGSDPELDALEYQTKLDMEAWTAWGPGMSRNVAGLASGNHTFYVRVRDVTGGTDQVQCAFKVNFGPTIAITNKPGGMDINTTAYTFNWTVTDDLDSPLTMEYNVELDGVWQGWQLGTSSYNWNPLPSGLRSFTVRVRDTGNPQLWAEDSCNFTVNYKPAVSIDDCPAGVWASNDITLNWTGLDDNSPEVIMDYSWRMDSDPWSAWQTGTLSAVYFALSEGAHTFTVRVRDTGNPVLYCDTPPDTCDTCVFTIDTSCAFPPSDVTNFNATDNDLTLNAREVVLTWTPLGGCTDFYDIERREYDMVAEAWNWVPLISVPHPIATYTDTNARYSGWTNPIEYRLRARNMTGTSPTWSTDTGYPITRKIYLGLWCTADDGSGTNPSTTWARAVADFQDANTFWNQYGKEFVAVNTTGFMWIGDPSLKDLTGGEDGIMHSTYGQVLHPEAINVYYVTSSNGSTNRGYCMCYCPGTNHNTNNVYIVLCRDTRGTPPAENAIVLAHELGHGASRYFDNYLLDGGLTCATQNTWCTVPPWTPPLFCDDNGTYPDGGDPPVPKNLMWYSYIGAPVSDYNVTVGMYSWTDIWIHGNEGNYPWP